MNLSKLSVNRPVTIMMLTLIVIILGGVSLSKLSIDLLPNIEVPVAVVTASYEGVGPQEIESMITKPLEEAVATVGNIDRISSISSEGNSVVVAEFNYGTDMDFATLEMREKVDLIKGFLPEEASDPMVMRIDPNMMPIVQIAIYNSGDLAHVQSFAEDVLKPRLERIDGVASVDISGGYKNRVEIKIDQQKLDGYGITVSYIAQIIGAENLNLPGGQVKKGIQELNIRTLGEFESIDDIKMLPITLPNGGVVYLGDIAEVQLVKEDLKTISRVNGNNSINISVQKQSGKNTVKVANEVRKELDKIKEEYPTVHIDIVLDQSDFIELSIQNVINSAILGAILAILILFIFLRNIRTTLVIGVSIPISIIATFILLYFNDITLNLMTLGGLALGVGMLVDNSIVVLENIYRFREQGFNRIEAAIKGASEVSMAVMASTLTTIAVFFPIVFVEGITSTIFKELAITVTLSLVASLVVALTLVPMLSSKLLVVDEGKKKLRLFRFINSGFDRIFNSIDLRYRKILNWALDHRKSTVIIALAVFVVSMASIFSLGAEFLPAMDQGQFMVNVSLPVGSELDSTNEILTEIEEKLKEIDEIQSVFTTVGSGGMMGGSSNSGSVTGILKPLDQRTVSTDHVVKQVRKLVKDIPGAEINVEALSNSMMGFGGSPITVEIKGDDLKTLEEISEDFKKIIGEVEGATEVKTSLSEGIPEVQIRINREKASQYGITSAQIASAVRGLVSGTVATRYKFEGDEIDVVIKGDDILRESISNLETVPIDTPYGVSVPLSQVAEIIVEKGPITINREGQSRVVSVTGQIVDRDLASITRDIEAKLSKYNMPQGYSYEFGGQNELLNEAFTDLVLALILAVILVYMVMASQFESLLHPFIIMFSVPLAFSGGALALFLTGIPLSVPAIIGFIILAGIVVNNAIVLVDYINTRRSEGEERREAVVNAGPIRLRPILMTTLTTVLGLVPLALGLGEGAEMEQPLAIAVIGGLSLSTVLTLVLIPVLYTIFDDIAGFFRRKIFKKAEEI